MGCDIHLHVEVRINDKWEHYAAPFINRDYMLFAKLANVRNNGSVSPVMLPRGLPTDMSIITKIDADRWGLDKHDASGLSTTEIEKVENWWNRTFLERDRITFGMEEQWGYLFGNSLSGIAKYPDSYPPEITDVRIVFWFDN